MARTEKALGKVAALTATLLSGWKLPTLKDVKALAALLFSRGK